MRIELWMALERVARRIRGARLWGGLTLCWLMWAALAGGAYWSVTAPQGSSAASDSMLLALGVGALATALLCTIRALRSARDPLWVARRIEARHPELSSVLMAATEQAASPPGRLGFLQTQVINQALQHCRRNPWEEMISAWKLIGLQIAHFSALAAFLVAFSALAVHARAVRPTETVAQPAKSERADYEIQVEPGNTELERGSSLLVVARFGRQVPADVALVTENASADSATRSMSRSLEDPAFAGRVAEVPGDLAYHVTYDGRRSETYRVTVFDYPAVERVDAILRYPAFTGKESQTIEDIRHVTAVEGTELTLIARLNKPVREARFKDEKLGDLTLVADADDPRVVRTTLTLKDSRRLSSELIDSEGRQQKQATDISIKVLPNKPATITMKRPSGDAQVSPLEELELAAELADDYGVSRRGIEYTTADGTAHELQLGGDESIAKKVEASHLLDFESLQAEPDQLVSFYFWAEDIGPDGQPRRTLGDMYFAEVRPFEEIFREGEAPSGGEQQQQQQQAGGAMQAAEELVELQKQIIAATWKLIRRETREKPSEEFAADSQLLVESQQQAIEQATAAAQELTDPKSMQAMEAAVKAMGEAFQRLQVAHDSAAPAEHKPALAAEQTAYQALLRLRAREFEVVQSNSPQSGGQASGGGNRSQRQLNELELSNDENRYENQSAAQAQQDQRQAQQHETREVLNRLKELAERQTDLNERLRELQSALQAAETEEQRAEIERQLKRLREQQQEILRDTDTLQERLEQEQNRDRMAETREQLQQTRENVRDASEALEQGQLSEALTEGTRAGNELNELRDQVRENSSEQFTEEMTEMRNEARELEERQQKLAEQLDAMNRREEQPSLRDNGERAGARENVQQQREQLENLLERMRNTVQAAEPTEPLLAQELYETVQDAAERRLDEALEVTDRLVEAGIPREARQVADQAGEGIRQLRAGVERAAENVLPNEAEALRRAEQQLDRLAEELNREMQSAPGESPSAAPTDPNAAPAQDPSTRTPGENSEGEEPGRSPSETPGEDGAPNGQQQGQGEQPQPQQGDGPPGEQPGQQPGNSAPSESPSGRAGQNSEGEPSAAPGSNPGGEPSENAQGQQPGGGGGESQQASFDQFLEGIEGGPSGPGGPITGEGYRDWADGMREVEELIEDPDLRAEAARIRDRVRGEREEYKRHSQEPDPKKLQELIAEPLMELRVRIREEIRKRESPDALAPIDRDPVPPQFSEGVRRYYERLGSGE
ncbi:MAG: hypothetical protein SGJ19_23595 [Planctomycetia bacterium]|nr:hypothetical protein [Planctomycetia bacterium]